MPEKYVVQHIFLIFQAIFFSIILFFVILKKYKN